MKGDVLVVLSQTAVNALLLWALCSNTFSLNEAAQASLKAKFKPSPLASASKIKSSQSVASAASSGGGGNYLLNKMATGGVLVANATASARSVQQQQLSAALCLPKVEAEPVSSDLRGESCAEGFKEGGGVVGVRTQCYSASYWPTD